MAPRLALLVFFTLSGLASCSLLVDSEGLTGPSSDAGAADRNAPDAGADRSGPSDGTPGPAPYAAAVLADEPALYYRFEDPGDGPVKDETGQHPGVYVSGTKHGVPGAFPGSAAIAVLGVGGVDAGDIFDFDDDKPFTLEAWAYVEAYDDAYRFLMLHDENVDQRQSWGIYFHSDDGIALERYIDDGSLAAYVTTPPEARTWHHVVGTYDGTKLRLYLDGIEIADNTDTRRARRKATPLVIGAKTDRFPAFNGRIDEVAIYERALDASRIRAHFDAAR